MKHTRTFSSRALILLLKCSLLIFGFLGISRFCHNQTGGFQITKILSDHPYNPCWEVSRQGNFDHLLNQPYRFFSYGGQSYVFLSEDGQTVIKFFKHHHMRTPRWLKRMPLPKLLSQLRHQWHKKTKQKLPLFFGSCQIAYEDFQDRTGLIYLHLNKTSHLNKKLTIIDKLNISHEIDLDSVDFALQTRAELPLQRFRRLKAEGNLKSAQASLQSLLDLIAERCQKGIKDRDPNIRRNCGFIGDFAVEIDLGSYTRDDSLKEPFAVKYEVYLQTRKLEHWIKKRYPELHPFMTQRLSALLGEDVTSSL